MTTTVALPRVLSESLGGSKLSRAMQVGDVPGLSRPRPLTAAEWRTAANEVRRRFNGDAWLKALAPAFGDSATLPGLIRAANDGILVTTGQQAGLFGGHMLTLVKALSARALADSMERAVGMPCATVFWAATDDADFLEAASVKIPGTAEGTTLSLTVAPPPGTPMNRAPLAGIDALLAQMEASCGSAGGEAVAQLRRAYYDGATVGDAYVRYLREILAPLGVAVLDASHVAVLTAARPLLQRALVDSAAVEGRARGWDDTLESAGLKPQVESVPGLSLVFANEDGVKRRIPITEAAATASSKIGLSPTVLLRPIVEATILPTVAYVGGPGEIAYFAQIPPIAAVLGSSSPTVVPRWSTTIVEAGITKILDRHAVMVDDLRDYDGLLSRLVRDRMPSDLSQTVGELRATLGRAIAALLEAGKQNRIDPKIIEGLNSQLAVRLDRGERRIVAAIKRRETELRRDLGTARASLYPDGVRQERLLSFVPFIARYNGPLIALMLAEASRHADTLVGVANQSASAP